MLPEFEFGLGLEDTDHDRRRERHAFVAQPLLEHGDIRRSRQWKRARRGRALPLDPVRRYVFKLNCQRMRALGGDDTEDHRRDKPETR